MQSTQQSNRVSKIANEILKGMVLESDGNLANECMKLMKKIDQYLDPNAPNCLPTVIIGILTPSTSIRCNDIFEVDAKHFIFSNSMSEHKIMIEIGSFIVHFRNIPFDHRGQKDILICSDTINEAMCDRQQYYQAMSHSYFQNGPKEPTIEEIERQRQSQEMEELKKKQLKEEIRPDLEEIKRQRQEIEKLKKQCQEMEELKKKAEDIERQRREIDLERQRQELKKKQLKEDIRPDLEDIERQRRELEELQKKCHELEKHKNNAANEKITDECVVCMDKKRSYLFVPCGHLSLCEGCSKTIMDGDKTCPTCRVVAVSCIRVFQ
jgi:hypothetical protein